MAATTDKKVNQPQRKGVWLILALVVIVALLTGLIMTGYLGDMT